MGSEPVPLHTLTWGSGDRRILLLHGIGSNAAGWWRLGDSLAAAGWTVIAPDLRGHGDSPKAADYRFESHVADLRELGARWDVVLGHSMGGLIATLAAHMAPDFTSGLILQDPALVLPEDQDEVLRWMLVEYRRPITTEQMAADNPRWLDRDVVTKVESLLAVGSETIAETTKVNWPWLGLEHFADLDLPRVVIGSDPETGGLLPMTIGRWLGDHPRARYSMLPRSSHSAHRDDDIWNHYLASIFGALDTLPTL